MTPSKIITKVRFFGLVGTAKIVAVTILAVPVYHLTKLAGYKAEAEELAYWSCRLWTR